MKRLVWLVALLWGLAATAAAADKPAGKQAPVDIRSDSLKVLQKKRQAVFSGHVVARQGELTIRCQRLVVHYGDEKKDQQIQRMLFSGSVDIQQGKRKGYCEKAEYDRVGRRILCTGKPWVEEGPNRIHGERIVFRLDADEVEVTRPRAQIQVPKPKSRKGELEKP